MIPKSVGIFVLVASCANSAFAWGGLFNRFNPSMMGNLGYGGHGKELFGVANKHVAENPYFGEDADGDLSENGKKTDNEMCSGKSCTANEHCCDGHVCVDTDETIGTCLPIWGKKQGEMCLKDNDCESGFLCLEDGNGRSCQSPVPGLSGLGEDCNTSSDCNVHKGLCCKLHRRAKSRPKKICSYFTDTQTCLGPVAGNFMLSGMEHTAGEKRISGHPDDFLHLKK